MKLRSYFLTMVRPVGSSCWTVERISMNEDIAMSKVQQELDKTLTFANGTKHKQSVVTIRVDLPERKCRKQKDYGIIEAIDTSVLLSSEKRTLPSGHTFTRTRCNVCECYWDHSFSKPGQKEEAEYHDPTCLLAKAKKKK